MIVIARHIYEKSLKNFTKMDLVKKFLRLSALIQRNRLKGIVDDQPTKLWMDLKEQIIRNPELLWTYDENYDTPMVYLASAGDISILEEVCQIIEKHAENHSLTYEERSQMLRQVFETPSERYLDYPVSLSLKDDNVECLQFFLEKSPSGVDLLNVPDVNGNTLFDWSFEQERLHPKSYVKCRQYIKKIYKLHHLCQEEQSCIEVQILMDNYSLPSLVLGVVIQNTEVLRYHT